MTAVGCVNIATLSVLGYKASLPLLCSAGKRKRWKLSSGLDQISCFSDPVQGDNLGTLAQPSLHCWLRARLFNQWRPSTLARVDLLASVEAGA